jgi:hypothetical protein
MLRELEEYLAIAKLGSSPLKLGEWIVDRFGVATIQQRRARERMVSDHPPPLSPEETPEVAIPKPPPISTTLATAAPIPAPVEDPPAPKVAPEPMEKSPVSVVTGTVDLGPPSSATLEQEPEEAEPRAPRTETPRRANRLVIALVLVAAAVVVWLAMGR